MATEQTAGGKEATILERTQKLIGAVRDLDARLETRFRRASETGKVSEDRPQAPNVLDEILDNLAEAQQRLGSVIMFISNEVLPKID